MDWSLKEAKLIVETYFTMLKHELVDEPYNKTLYRKNILPFLAGRSEGSIEFKHQNISAVLIDMGLPFINGYKPKFNYQQLLVKAITEYLESNQSVIEYEFEQFSRQQGSLKEEEFDFMHFVIDEPITSPISDNPPLFTPIKVNYLEREQKNNHLGQAGEQLIMEYEKWRLIDLGKEKLAETIEWISKDVGDGAGFDILSKNINGTDRYIEVKTTKLSKETPIYVTANEIAFAELKQESFFLYRVFNFNSSPKLFFRNGSYTNFCTLTPQTFKAYFS